MIDFIHVGTTFICCDNGFDGELEGALRKVTTYRVLDDQLILEGDDSEVKLVME